MTGYIQFPTTDTYTFQFAVDDSARLWLDDALALERTEVGVSGGSVQVAATAGQRMRIRIDYKELTSGAQIYLKWKTALATVFDTVPGQYLTPDYGVLNSTTTDDVDPAGLNLRTRMAYNATLQRATRTLPAQVARAGPAKNSVYWGGNETLTAAACGLPVGTRQNGFLKQITSPAPASGTAVTAEFVYDNFGRTVGVKRGAEGWSCTTFDARSRPVSVTTPAFGTTLARTTINLYTQDGTVAGNPLVTSQTDSLTPGSVSTTTDLLGRVLSYTDTWGTVTTTTYEPLTGRVSAVSITSSGKPAKAMQYLFDADGRVVQIKDAGSPIADLTYPERGAGLGDTSHRHRVCR